MISQKSLFIETLHSKYARALTYENFHRTYVKKGSKEAGAKDVPDSMDEFARQREYMERSLQTLKKRAMKNEEAVKINNVKKASENAMLIDELNALRRDKRLLEVKVQELTCDLQSTKRVRSRASHDAPSSPSGAELPSATSTMPPAGKRPGSSGRGSAGAGVAPPSSSMTSPGPSRPTSKGGRVHKGNALSWNELVSSERAKVAAMLTQLDENNREIEGQRYEIKRLREQVQMLLQRAPLESDMGAEMDNRSYTAPLHRDPTPDVPAGGLLPRERSKSSLGVKGR
jgi:hypothetical protein